MSLPPPTQALRPITRRRLATARERLVASQLYLGDVAVRDHVEWLRDGRCHRLVVKPEVTAERIEQREAEPPTASSPTDEDAESPPLELACISMVGTISDEDFYLVSDANWRPSVFAPDFHSVRATGSIGAPDVEPFSADHKEVLDNLRWIQGVVATPGFDKQKGMFVGPDSAPRVKFRHILFEPREDPPRDAAATGAVGASDTAAEDSPVSTGLGDDKENNNDGDGLSDEGKVLDQDQDDEALGPNFRIENWPCYTDITQSALKKIEKTHRVVPIPAYDMHGDLIDPRMYRSRIMGAVVALQFTLTHWSIAGNKDTPDRAKLDVYVADLHHIRVLVPPKPCPVTPRKRKIAAVDPSEGSPSPSKRQRTSEDHPSPSKKQRTGDVLGM